MNKTLSGLYAITNEEHMPETVFLKKAEAALASGVQILQYRDKSDDHKKRQYQAQALKVLCEQYQAVFIINDDIALAKKVNADGVHIGKDDDALTRARTILGADKIIGVSCYNQLSLAQKAMRAGANYIAFGRFFDSSTKPNAPLATRDLITTLKRQSDIPICCIGGITTHNFHSLIEAGADMVAVINDIFSYSTVDEIRRQCQLFTQP